MKRSHQDAIVGFTLLGGLVLFSGLLIWLQGLRIGRNDWTIAAIFDNASGLSEGTPVTYRGIKVGSIENIKFNYKEVKAKIRINNKNLILFKPAYAKITASSVLGRDIEVSLLSKGAPIEDIINLPNQKDCQKNLIVCEGDVIKGKEINSISTLTEGLNELLNQADEEKLVPKMLESISQFDQTQEE